MIHIPSFNKRYAVLISTLLIVGVIGILFWARKPQQPVTSHIEPGVYSFQYPQTWNLTLRDTSSLENFEDTCEEITDIHNGKGYAFNICGPYATPFEDVLKYSLLNGPALVNETPVRLTVDGHRAAMVKGETNGLAEIHVYVEDVKLPQYTGENPEEEERELALVGITPLPTPDEPWNMTGTLHIIFMAEGQELDAEYLLTDLLSTMKIE